MPITFSYRHPDVDPDTGGKQPLIKTLRLRHNPNEAEWTYNLNTSVTDTYGGQVIQVLSVNIDRLTIRGQLGKEGPFGRKRVTRHTTDPRWGGPVPGEGLATRDIHEQFDYQGVRYPGLISMTEFFREYFAVVSQGGDPQNPGRFLQIPMEIHYGGTDSSVSREEIEIRTWVVTPTEFPSFRRSNDSFAPEWEVVCQVIEADQNIKRQEKQAAIDRLQDAVGYNPINPFSDPLADPKSDIAQEAKRIAAQLRSVLPNFTHGDIENLVWNNVSLPNIGKDNPLSKAIQQNTSEYYSGEVATNIQDVTQGGKFQPGD